MSFCLERTEVTGAVSNVVSAEATLDWGPGCLVLWSHYKKYLSSLSLYNPLNDMAYRALLKALLPSSQPPPKPPPKTTTTTTKPTPKPPSLMYCHRILIKMKRWIYAINKLGCPSFHPSGEVLHTQKSRTHLLRTQSPKPGAQSTTKDYIRSETKLVTLLVVTHDWCRFPWLQNMCYHAS